jgi:hypothetical protein
MCNASINFTLISCVVAGREIVIFGTMRFVLTTYIPLYPYDMVL